MHVFVRAGIRNKIAWLWGMHLFHFNCSCAVTKLCPTLCNPIDCSTVFPVLHYFLELAQTHVHWVSDAIQPSHPLSPPSLVLNVSQHQGLFQWVVSLHQVAKYWNFSFSPSNEYSGLISFKIDWFYLLAIQGPVKSLLQHHSSKASILQCSAFFMIQLSLPYMTIGRTLHSLITLTVNFQCKHILFSGHGFQQHQVKWQNIKYYFIRH